MWLLWLESSIVTGTMAQLNISIFIPARKSSRCPRPITTKVCSGPRISQLRALDCRLPDTPTAHARIAFCRLPNPIISLREARSSTSPIHNVSQRISPPTGPACPLKPTLTTFLHSSLRHSLVQVHLLHPSKMRPSARVPILYPRPYSSPIR